MKKLTTLMFMVTAAAVGLLGIASTPANAVDLSSGLISYWPFDNNGANPTLDAENGNNGTLFSPTYQCDAADIAPVDGNVCSLDFVPRAFVQVADNSSLEPTDVTVSAWVRNDGDMNVNAYIVAKTRDNGKAAYALYAHGKGINFFASSAVTFFLSPNPGNTWDGEWHHVAGIYDSSGPTVRLFFDGVEVGSGNTGPDAIDYNEVGLFGDLFIGTYSNQDRSYQNAAWHWPGNIDEVRVYDRVLTDEEIAALCACSGPLIVDIDIKPGSFPNSINLGSGGGTPVAILGSASLDVNDIDTSTLVLGTSGVKTVGKTSRELCSVVDVSGDFTSGPEGAPDSFDDLVCHFVTMGMVPEAGNTQATLSGSLNDSTPFEGTDSVNIVP